MNVGCVFNTGALVLPFENVIELPIHPYFTGLSCVHDRLCRQSRTHFAYPGSRVPLPDVVHNSSSMFRVCPEHIPVGHD